MQDLLKLEAAKFDGHLGGAASDVLVKFQKRLEKSKPESPGFEPS